MIAAPTARRDILKELEQEGHKIVYQAVNQGKGAALRLGFSTPPAT